jgi:hypothetical protein
MKQVLNHLDKIYFGSGAMLLFKYPMQKRLIERHKAEIQEEESGLEADEIEVLAFNRLLNSGVTDDITALDEIVCNDYTDAEIEADMTAVDFDSAQAEVERMEEEKRKK